MTVADIWIKKSAH